MPGAPPGRATGSLAARLMLVSPVVSAVLKALVAWRPGLLTLTLEKVLCDTLRTISGTTMCAQALRETRAG